jgi:hypothetical protein
MIAFVIGRWRVTRLFGDISMPNARGLRADRPSG